MKKIESKEFRPIETNFPKNSDKIQRNKRQKSEKIQRNKRHKSEKIQRNKRQKSDKIQRNKYLNVVPERENCVLLVRNVMAKSK